ncbi:zinc-binding dehydrogenase [Actinotalea sp. K2]|uniref:zinc-dependent alcohol dehydrogenase n=1 Tax=Actinotalea sp. K2 TaxID=2939438 RepID=UPI0020177F62|nr:zinc-binding dehydrogenase [Actinotalea sp. K2]MCL3859741.1 zinc-binding dehydrogenase [Actinotalea sp. K2]
MRVARLHAVGDVRVGHEADPVPTQGQSLVRVTAVGLCGSDLHWFSEGGIGDAGLSTPLVLGHELAGVVQGGPQDGVRVAVDPAHPCGRCEHCLEGNRNLCPTVGFAGHGRTDGGLRELVAWPTELLHPVPDALSDADAAMLEPLGVALHAMDLARPRLGATVAVVGCGPIGLCVVQLARAAGATRVVAVEPLAHRRAAAVALGADVALDAHHPDILDQVAEATHGRGADVVVEVAGNDAAVGLSVHAARAGAKVILAGIPGQDSTTFPASVARRKGLSLLLSRRMKEMYPRTTRLVERGVVDVRSVVTHTFGLDDSAQAFAVADARTGLKVVVEPGA